MLRRVIRTAAAAVVLSTAVVAGAVASVGIAGATSTPKLVVVPSGSLTNNKIVTVKGTGFKPRDRVYVTECLVVAKDSAGCNISTAVPATINAKGVLPATKFKVTIGVIGSGTCGTKVSNLKSCAISVGNISGHDTASARITFLPPKKP
jgi:hypothetical protein